MSLLPDDTLRRTCPSKDAGNSRISNASLFSPQLYLNLLSVWSPVTGSGIKSAGQGGVAGGASALGIQSPIAQAVPISFDELLVAGSAVGGLAG